MCRYQRACRRWCSTACSAQPLSANYHVSIASIWYAASGHHPDVVAEHRARSPWYLTKTTPSFADMLAKLRRVIIATQYHPGQAQTPIPAEIQQVQQARAAAGL